MAKPCQSAYCLDFRSWVNRKITNCPAGWQPKYEPLWFAFFPRVCDLLFSPSCRDKNTKRPKEQLDRQFYFLLFLQVIQRENCIQYGSPRKILNFTGKNPIFSSWSEPVLRVYFFREFQFRRFEIVWQVMPFPRGKSYQNSKQCKIEIFLKNHLPECFVRAKSGISIKEINQIQF